MGIGMASGSADSDEEIMLGGMGMDQNGDIHHGTRGITEKRDVQITYTETSGNSSVDRE